jgi:hypothetical protein
MDQGCLAPDATLVATTTLDHGGDEYSERSRAAQGRAVQSELRRE